MGYKISYGVDEDLFTVTSPGGEVFGPASIEDDVAMVPLGGKCLVVAFEDCDDKPGMVPNTVYELRACSTEVVKGVEMELDEEEEEEEDGNDLDDGDEFEEEEDLEEVE